MKKMGILAAAVLVLGSSLALAAEKVPNSLADAEEGEWALYEVPNGYRQRLIVIERDGAGPDATVTVQVDNIYNGEVVSSAFYSDTAGEPMTDAEAPGGGKVAKVSREKFTVKGKSYDATMVKIESDDQDDGDTEWWVAAEVPVFGLVKRVEDDETTMELLDFGKN